MTWHAIAITGYLLMLLQLGLAPHIAFGTQWPVAPQFVLLLAVFVALTGTPRSSLITSALLGLMLDLTSTYPQISVDSVNNVVEQAGVVVVGPYTLGYMAGAALVHQIRPMLLRHHPLTVATMMVVFGLAAHLVVVGLLAARTTYEPIQGFAGMQQMGLRFLSLLYSAAVGVLLAYPLLHFTKAVNKSPLKMRGKK